MSKRSPAPEQEIEAPALEESDDALIARVSAARRSGDPSESGVSALLRSAAERNKAALDRLAK